MRFREGAGDGEALTFEVERGPSALRLEVSPSRRLRLVAGERRLMWAELWSGHYGVTLVRSDDPRSPEILPPMRSAEVRRVSTREAWLRRLARSLAESSRAPLRSGTWRLVALKPHGAGRFAPRSGEVGLAAFDLFDALTAPRAREDDFGAQGSWSVWPLRRPPEPDAPRVKAWRKHARDGTLPPVVLAAVSGLSTHLLVDGHDRLAAAHAEGVTPELFVLAPVREVAPDEGARARVAEAYARSFEAVPEAGRAALGEALVRAFSPLLVGAPSVASFRSGLDAEWEEEVRAVLGEPAFRALFVDAT